jgi:hypothetical protein
MARDILEFSGAGAAFLDVPESRPARAEPTCDMVPLARRSSFSAQKPLSSDRRRRQACGSASSSGGKTLCRGSSSLEANRDALWIQSMQIVD